MTRPTALIVAIAGVALIAGCTDKPRVRAEIPRGGVVTYSKHLMALDGDTLWTTVAITSSGSMRVYLLQDTLRVLSDDELWRAQVLR